MAQTFSSAVPAFLPACPRFVLGLDAYVAQEFIAKWRATTVNERAASQEHFIDLCRLLGEPTPIQADPTGTFYRSEKEV